MDLIDKLLLLDLCRKYGAPLEVSGLLARVPKLFEPDLVAISGVLARLPESELAAVARHPATPEAIRAFIDTVDEPALVVAARLKLGLPVRGLTLPALLRQAIAVEVYDDGGVLRVRAQDRKPAAHDAHPRQDTQSAGPSGA